jgi:hypothetical protein
MDDIADSGTDTSDHILLALQFLLERLEALFVGNEELNIVSRGKSDVTAAILFRHPGEIPDSIGAEEPW